MKKIITVQRDGTMKFVYDDRLKGLMQQGHATITRASHVEPTPDNEWGADMSPVGGPMLGPFNTRQEALDAEVEWINHNVLTGTRR